MTTQDGPKTAQDRPRHPQDTPKTAQDPSKTTLLYLTAGGSFPTGGSWGDFGRSKIDPKIDPEIEPDPDGPKSLWSYACRCFRA